MGRVRQPQAVKGQLNGVLAITERVDHWCGAAHVDLWVTAGRNA